MNSRYGGVFLNAIIPIASSFVLSTSSLEARANGWNFFRSIWAEYPDVILGHKSISQEVLFKVNEVTGLSEMEYGGETPDRDLSEEAINITSDQYRMLVEFIRFKSAR
jgi:hypothetical protein